MFEDPGEYLHGTSAKAAVSVAVEGFRVVEKHGALGSGIYVTRALREAAAFSTEHTAGQPCILRVEFAAGTRIARIEDSDYDTSQLCREFGAEILGPNFANAIPHNKQLEPRQLFALIRHLDRTEQLASWTAHGRKALRSVRQWLRRLHYHGFGHGSNDLGVVLFDPSNLRLVEATFLTPDGFLVPATPGQLAEAAERDLDLDWAHPDTVSPDRYRSLLRTFRERHCADGDRRAGAAAAMEPD